MDNFTVVRYTSDKKTEWNAFVAISKNGTFLFDRDFMEYHSDRFTDFSLLVYKDQKLTAIFPANIHNNIVHSHQGLTYGGLVLLKTTKFNDALESYKAILHFLQNANIQKLIIKLIPTFYNLCPADELSYFLFKSNAKLVNRDLAMVIDYRNMLGFKKNRREGINRAVKKGLRIVKEQKFDDFWNSILIPNLDNRYGTKPVHTLKEIKRLAQNFPNNIVQFNVYYQDTIVGGTTVFLTQNTVHPQYVSANELRHQLGTLDFLYQQVIDYWKEDNSKHYFDFNTSSENDGKLLNNGLIFWKETSGARPYITEKYEVDVTKKIDINFL